MDDTYLLAAARYMGLNPVRAKLVKKPEHYKWSSYNAHVKGKDDALVKTAPLHGRVNDWRLFLQKPVSDLQMENLRKHEKTGRPIGSDPFIEQLENTTGRYVRKKKPGPKGPRKKNNYVSCPLISKSLIAY